MLSIILEWQLGAIGCKLSTFINSTTSCASIFTLVAVSLYSLALWNTFYRIGYCRPIYGHMPHTKIPFMGGPVNTVHDLWTLGAQCFVGFTKFGALWWSKKLFSINTYASPKLKFLSFCSPAFYINSKYLNLKMKTGLKLK